jgi:NADH-quinone oxidoreductase subunit B
MCPIRVGDVTTATAIAGAGYRLADRSDVRVVLSHLGLACCSLEVDAAVQRGLLVGDDSPGAAHTVLILAGTVTQALAPAVLHSYEQLAGRVSVLALGACACTGGPYWDAPTVVAGADRLVPVDRYVPGCPPRPEALVAAVLSLVDGVRP